MTDNEKDMIMLRSDPRGLLLRYQETVRIIVRKYIASGLFKPCEYEDVMQEVNASLLTKIPSIQAQYNGLSLFRTYFSVVVRNICLKEHERLRRNPAVDIETVGEIPRHDRVEDRIAIEREVQRFRTILALYRKRGPKLLFCLKVRFRIPISLGDIAEWFPALSSAEVDGLIRQFGGQYDDVEDHMIYEIITPLFNRLENKNNSRDALRKWTDAKIIEILRLLNGPGTHSKHTPETLKILLDDYFSPFLVSK